MKENLACFHGIQMAFGIPIVKSLNENGSSHSISILGLPGLVEATYIHLHAQIRK